MKAVRLCGIEPGPAEALVRSWTRSGQNKGVPGVLGEKEEEKDVPENGQPTLFHRHAGTGQHSQGRGFRLASGKQIPNSQNHGIGCVRPDSGAEEETAEILSG